MNRRSVLKGVGFGLAGVLVAGGASYYYSLLRHLQRKPLIIGGSTTVKRFVDKLAEVYIIKHREVDLIVEGGHSYAGLVALNRGTADLAMVSHMLRPSEDDIDLHSYLVGIEAVAVVVHPSLPLDNLSIANARLIFEQKITNWRDIGGPDKPIKVFSRDFHSTTKITIEQVLMQGKLINERATELRSSAEMAQEISLEPYSIGFLSAREFTPGIKPLRINDIPINEKTVLLSMYPLLRPLFLVDRDNSTPTAKSFLGFALSEEGQAMIAQSGAARVR